MKEPEIPELQKEFIEAVSHQAAPQAAQSIRRISQVANITEILQINPQEFSEAFTLVYDANYQTNVIKSIKPIEPPKSKVGTTQLQPHEALQVYFSPPPKLRRLSKDQRQFFNSGKARLFAKIEPAPRFQKDFENAGFLDNWIAVPSRHPYPYPTEIDIIDNYLYSGIDSLINVVTTPRNYHNLNWPRPLPLQHNAFYKLEHPKTLLHLEIGPLQKPIIGVPQYLQENLGEWHEENIVPELLVPEDVDPIPVRNA